MADDTGPALPLDPFSRAPDDFTPISLAPPITSTMSDKTAGNQLLSLSQAPTLIPPSPPAYTPVATPYQPPLLSQYSSTLIVMPYDDFILKALNDVFVEYNEMATVDEEKIRSIYGKIGDLKQKMYILEDDGRISISVANRILSPEENQIARDEKAAEAAEAARKAVNLAAEDAEIAEQKRLREEESAASKVKWDQQQKEEADRLADKGWGLGWGGAAFTGGDNNYRKDNLKMQDVIDVYSTNCNRTNASYKTGFICPSYNIKNNDGTIITLGKPIGNQDDEFIPGETLNKKSFTMFNKEAVNILYFAKFILIQAKDAGQIGHLTDYQGNRSIIREVVYNIFMRDNIDKVIEMYTPISNSPNMPATATPMDEDSKMIEVIPMDLIRMEYLGEDILKIKFKDYTNMPKDVFDTFQGYSLNDAVPINSETSIGSSDIQTAIKEHINKKTDINGDKVDITENTEKETIIKRFADAFNKTIKKTMMSRFTGESIKEKLRRLRMGKYDNATAITVRSLAKQIEDAENTVPKKDWKGFTFFVPGKGSMTMGAALEYYLNINAKPAEDITQLRENQLAALTNLLAKIKGLDIKLDADLKGLSITSAVPSPDAAITDYTMIISNTGGDACTIATCIYVNELLKQFLELLYNDNLDTLANIRENIANKLGSRQGFASRTVPGLLAKYYDSATNTFVKKSMFGKGNPIDAKEFAVTLHNELKKNPKSWTGGKSRRARKYKTKRCMKGGRKTRKHRRRRHTMKM